VFQFDYLVEDIVLMGRYPWLQMMQSWSNEDRQLVHGVLEQMELLELRNRYFSQLSGGEKQRVLIARALAQNTRFIFLDETLSQLDINHQIEIMKMLKTIRTDSGKGIVLISHNLNLAANHADKLIFMKSGRILAEGEPDLLLEPGLLAKMFNVELQTVRNPVSGRINIFYP
ncbi:MAG: ABC transporter ATP-binding protein, partial [Candidatus Cloacimonetes bacterium]|nr:ABC transporter ATP-binding protein [Candidatus Cloacimonadota bacterium]